MAIESSVMFLPCSNIDKTTAFYRDTIGLAVAQEQAGGICKIFDTGYGYLGFCQYGDGRPLLGGPVGVCISLNCRDEADVDQYYDKLVAKGVPVGERPQSWSKFKVYSFFLTDPDSYKVEFQFIQLPDQPLTGGRVD